MFARKREPRRRNRPRIFYIATASKVVRRWEVPDVVLVASPETLAAAATDLAGIGSTISAANAAAGAPTTGVIAAAADEVSAQLAALFGAHALDYQALSGQVAKFHDQFVRALTAGGAAYAAAEAANASPLQAAEQTMLNAVNAPTQSLLGRPLIGDGAPGASGPVGAPGGDGGLLFGNGGKGGDSTSPTVPGGNGGSAGLLGNGGPAAPAGPATSSTGSAVSAGWAAEAERCSASAGPVGPAGPAAIPSPAPKAAWAGLAATPG